MYFNPPRVISAITRTHSSLWEETQHGRLLVYSGCSTNSLEFHSLSRDDGACGNCIYFFLFVFFVLSHSRMQCLLSHSHSQTYTHLSDPRKPIQRKTRTHTFAAQNTIGTDYQNKYPGSLALCKRKLHIFERNLIKNY